MRLQTPLNVVLGITIEVVYALAIVLAGFFIGFVFSLR